MKKYIDKKYALLGREVKADDKLTKYCTNDNITELEPEDDAAAVKWRGHWRMPNDTEQWELLNLCKWDRNL